MITDKVAELRLLVRTMTWEAEGVVSVTLADPGGAVLPVWAPGAHVDVELPNEIMRQFSLCGDPSERRAYRIGVLREAAGRGGSAYVHDTLRVGAALTVRGPRNNFTFRPAPRVLFVAGGIGITPLLPMIPAADAAGADWRLLYGGRRRASMAFLGELEPYGDRVTVCPQDEVGLLDLDGWLGEPQADTVVYCCGPEPLLEVIEERCRAWPPEALQVERFAPRPIEVPDDGERGFRVVCQRSGLMVEVGADKSVLEALRAAGVDLPSSCEEGMCGTCETAILEGTPDHRDSILSPAERAANETMMLCVSRACSDVVILDL